MTERQLIAAAQGGDVAARNELILACLPHLRRAVTRLAPAASRDQREDLCHESVCALYDALEAYDLGHPSRPRLYVFAATRVRKAVAAYFRATPSTCVSIEEVPEPTDLDQGRPERIAESMQITSLVRLALSKLSRMDSHVLYSRCAVEPAPPRAVLARQFGCSQQWIERVERRAAAKVAELLEAPIDSGASS